VKRGISSFIREQPDKFHRRARRGIPAEYRWTVWKACVSHDERFVRNVYWKLTGLGSENEQWGRAIKIDVPRTFPRDQAARNGSQMSEVSLYRILVAYANLNPDVGYCQGMNFVAGLLLLVSGEEEAFWVFVCLMEYDGLAGFYRENFPLLGRYTHAFDELLARELPDLRDHFTEEGVQPTLYIHQWYLSLFINCLPLQTVFVLWDVIVSDGLPIILSISIALLKVLRPALMQMEFEDIVRFFKTMKTGRTK
ncbi:TBC domain containing protein, putative, partial [Perkinsus marinus ATCC 50983]